MSFYLYSKLSNQERSVMLEPKSYKSLFLYEQLELLLEELKENPTKELSIEGEDFVLLSRETYYKLKEYEAMCSGLL